MSWVARFCLPPLRALGPLLPVSVMTTKYALGYLHNTIIDRYYDKVGDRGREARIRKDRGPE